MTMYVVFHTIRSTTGKPNQEWAPNVFLTDHWGVEESKEDAVASYNKLVDRDFVHSAGIAPIDKDYSTDWFYDEEEA